MNKIPQETIQKLSTDYHYNDLDTTQLNDDEFKFYAENLAEFREERKDLSYLYFDLVHYGFVQGYVIRKYNKKGELISNDYKVERFEQYAVADNICDKIKVEKIVTNIKASHLFLMLTQKIVTAYVPELDKKYLQQRYIDLIGKIEEQNDKNQPFFNKMTTFKEQIEKIDRNEQTFPCLILALINWYHLLQ